MTALQILISNWTTEIENNSSNSPIYKCFINEAESFLEKEKQQIIEAYEVGVYELECGKNNSLKYYQETYENN